MGPGGDCAFTKNWTGRLEYERVRVKFLDEKVDIDLLNRAAVYRL